MNHDPRLSRRRWLQSAAAACYFGAAARTAQASSAGKAQIAITLDLEMSRNFPEWDDTHWDYEKGNLDQPSKRYAVASGELVKRYGGRVHYFCVGQTLEQADVSWLASLHQAGHPIGNHTYDHVYLLAKESPQLQYRFRRSPWLIEGREIEDVIRENIRMTTLALQQRAEVDDQGFRTPGGFHQGLKERQDLQQMLIDLGFSWVSSLYPKHANTMPGEKPSEAVIQDIIDAHAKAQPFVYPSGLVEIPMSPISDIGAFRNGRWKLEWFLEVVERLVRWTIEHRMVYDFLAHPSCLGVIDPELKTIEMICRIVREAGDAAELVDLNQIAETTAG
jgi:peptidoglycan/xylan/chitin deacetylase (PgdA/CDA1 family)